MKTSYLPIILLSSLFISACGSMSGPKGEKELASELERKQEELQELRGEIDRMEKELAQADSGKGSEGRMMLIDSKRMKPRRFEHFFKVSGSVVADHEVLLSPERQGKIEEIHVREGDRVEKGDLVASQSQAVLRSRLQEMRARYEHAHTLFEKQKRLWKGKGIGSEMDYLDAKSQMESLRAQKNTLEEELKMTRIEAPIDGTIEELRLKKGAFASPSTPIAHIVGLQDLSVEADVSEEYLTELREGDTVWIDFPQIDASFIRPIQSIGDRIHPEDRTFEVRVDLQNTPDRKIKPNLSATLRLRDLTADSALVVPSGVLRSDGKGDFVYLVSDSDTALKRYVELGLSQNGRTMIRSGLNDGDRLVVAGYDRLSKGMAVREKKKNLEQRRSSDR